MVQAAFDHPLLLSLNQSDRERGDRKREKDNGEAERGGEAKGVGKTLMGRQREIEREREREKERQKERERECE